MSCRQIPTSFENLEKLCPAIIRYGIPFFNPGNIGDINKLEQIQKKFTRLLFAKTSRPNYITRLTLFDLHPLEHLFIKYGGTFL